MVDRSEKNLGFTGESHSFYWKDTIGSWIFPSASNTEGWYYSSIIVTFIIFFGFFTILSNQKKINFFEKKLFIFSVIMILFITYYTWGKNSVLFLWSWENIPLLGSLRAWPRLNILIVPFIILLFSLSLKNLKAYFEENNKKNLDKIIKLFFLIFICCLSLQFIFYFFDYQNQYYWDFWQKKRFDAAIDYLPNILGNILKLYDGEIYILFSIFCIIFLITILSKNRLRKNITQFYTAILFLSSLELFVLSNLQWSLPEWKTKIYKIDNPLKELQNGFNSKRIIDTVKGNEYFRDNRSFNVNYPDSYGYKKHAENFDTYFQRTNGIKNINISNNDIELVKLFYGASNEAKKIFLSESLNHENIVSFVNDSKNFEKLSNFTIKIFIDEYDGNNLELEVKSEKDGWLSFIDNWDHGWMAVVNGKKVQIYKLLGSYKSIKIKKGFSKVKFQYKPW